jgi:antitoxin component HigA of HigAB toxin-antitoxin module
MAELVAVLGLTASILTLVDGTSKALEFAKALHKAPDEIASLQHELASFQIAIQDIAACEGDRELLSSMFENELSRSRVVVQKLQTFIETSLLRKGLPSRRRWAKKVGRMNQLREDLRVARNQVILYLSVSNS